MKAHGIARRQPVNNVCVSASVSFVVAAALGTGTFVNKTLPTSTIAIVTETSGSNSSHTDPSESGD
jgi:hypothetical protein